MDIQYLGEAAFLLKGEHTVAVNAPHDGVPADIRLTSRRQDPARVTVSGPGEYEIRGVMIETVESGEAETTTLAHAVDLGELRMLHLGERVNELKGSAIDGLGKIDVLLVDTTNLEAAKRAVTVFEPAVTVPFGPNAAELCKELGIASADPEPRFTWRKGTEKPPKAVLLKITRFRQPKAAEKPAARSTTMPTRRAAPRQTSVPKKSAATETKTESTARASSKKTESARNAAPTPTQPARAPAAKKSSTRKNRAA